MTVTVVSKIRGFLKLVRIQNLLMIALTQFVLRYFVLHKVLISHGISPALGDDLFFLLVLSTVFIAAGGYIINDYFDVKTDLINHPETVVVDTVIKRRWAIILHLLFTIAGVMLGIFAASKTGFLRLSLFHLVAALLLWFYSTNFKRQLLIGNVTVSLLTAAITLMPFIFEMGVMQKVDPDFVWNYRHAVISSFKYAWIYAMFAFITTMAREIIKDLEDLEGDRATGCNTLPIAWGTRSARLTAFFLIVITVLLLVFAVYNTIRFQNYLISMHVLYLLLVLIIPLSLLGLYMLRATAPLQFGNTSRWLKVVMLGGLFYAVIFYFF